MSRSRNEPDRQLVAPNRTLLLPDKVWQALGSSLKLSVRERQVAMQVFREKKEETIAEELGISRSTVHTHLERIYRKLDVSCRSAMVVRFFEAYVALYGSGNGESKDR